MLKIYTSDEGSYSLKIENKCGITFSSSETISLKNIKYKPTTFITDTLCNAQNSLLKIDSIKNTEDTITISWYKNNNLIQSGISQQLIIKNFDINQAGLYKVILSNKCGNVESQVASLVLNKIQPGFQLDTLNSCTEKLLINLKDTSKSLFKIVNHYWAIPEIDVDLQNREKISYQFNLPGKFTIRHAVEDAHGCISDTIYMSTINYGKPIANFSVKDNCLMELTLPNDSSYAGYGGTKITKYTWDFGDTLIINQEKNTSSYSYLEPGMKTVKLVVLSDNNCISDTLSKQFMVFGKPDAKFSSIDSCQGYPVKFINNSVTKFYPDSISNFVWDFDEGDTLIAENPQYTFSEYGTHKVTLKAYSANCPTLYGDTTVKLSIKYPRKDSIYSRVNGIKGVQGQLSAAKGGKSYTWKPLSGLSDSRIQTPVYKLNDSKILYTITIIDSAGCINKDQQEVWAFEKPDIFIATGFSPNNDGINDLYVPEYVYIKYIDYFQVLDKNNRQIFITNDMKAKWDGTYKGTSLPQDPYMVVVSGVDIYGNKIKKQGVLILVK